jgi:hypothetical protein
MNSSVDRPWSQYFCCPLAGNRDFVLKHPVVTKLWLKAVLKATDLCASDPRRVARRLRAIVTALEEFRRRRYPVGSEQGVDRRAHDHPLFHHGCKRAEVAVDLRPSIRGTLYRYLVPKRQNQAAFHSPDLKFSRGLVNDPHHCRYRNSATNPHQAKRGRSHRYG